jgi:HAD superfamily hydrolase (TIGR01509 family)
MIWMPVGCIGIGDMSVQAVLFDLDNTLTDRRASISEYARQFAVDYAIALGEIDPGELEKVILHGDGNGYRPKEELFVELATMLPWKLPPDIADLREHWYAVSPICMQPRLGMHETLRALEGQGVRLGIITNGRTATQDATIRALCIRDLMAVEIISQAVGMKKPAPEIFHLALKGLDLNAAVTWYVGDHPVNDVLGASAAGLTGVWLNTREEWPSSYPKPQVEIHTLPDLLKLLSR